LIDALIRKFQLDHNTTDVKKKHLSDVIETLSEMNVRTCCRWLSKIPYWRYGISQAFKSIFEESTKS